jgi:biopolymer transport protein ExbB
MPSTGKSFWELFQLGGPFMWPLLALSIVSVAVILDRLLAVLGTLESLPNYLRALRPLVLSADWEGVERLAGGRRPLRAMTRAYSAGRGRPPKIREEILRREGTLLLERLEIRLRWLGVVGQLAPMVGLAGTVLGLVFAFARVEAHGGAVQAGLLAGGIWQALITTVAGLGVAIPSLLAFHLFEGRIDTVARRLSLLTSYLDEWSADASGTLAAEGAQPLDGAAASGNGKRGESRRAAERDEIAE